MQTVLQAQVVASGIGANVGEPARMGATARWFGKSWENSEGSSSCFIKLVAMQT